MWVVFMWNVLWFLEVQVSPSINDKVDVGIYVCVCVCVAKLSLLLGSLSSRTDGWDGKYVRSRPSKAIEAKQGKLRRCDGSVIRTPNQPTLALALDFALVLAHAGLSSDRRVASTVLEPRIGGDKII